MRESVGHACSKVTPVHFDLSVNKFFKNKEDTDPQLFQVDDLVEEKIVWCAQGTFEQRVGSGWPLVAERKKQVYAIDHGETTLSDESSVERVEGDRQTDRQTDRERERNFGIHVE